MPHAFNKNFTGHAGVMQGFFGGGGSTKKCNHDCDQSLIKSSWGSV